MNNKEQIDNYLTREGFQKFDYHKSFGKTVVQGYRNCCYAIFINYTFDKTIPYQIYLTGSADKLNADWRLYYDEFTGYGFNAESHKYNGDSYSEKIMWNSDLFRGVFDTIEMSKGKSPAIFNLLVIRWNYLYYE
jgi:hypothetical protein